MKTWFRKLKFWYHVLRGFYRKDGEPIKCLRCYSDIYVDEYKCVIESAVVELERTCLNCGKSYGICHQNQWVR